MKTRRALQIIVGILSLIVATCILVVAAATTLFLYFNLSEVGTEISGAIYQGLSSIAISFFGLSEELAMLVPALFYGLPFALLLLAAILLFLHKTPKQAKYVASSVLALIGVTVLSVFTIWFAPTILGGNPYADSRSDIVQQMVDSADYVRYAMGGLLGVFVIFIGSALGVKPKQAATETTDDVATVEGTVTETAETQAVVEDSEQPVVNEQTSEQEVVQIVEPITHTEVTPLADETPATEYVPDTDVSVKTIVQNTYGTEKEELSADAVAKINKLRLLYEANAITQEEYLKLVNIYLGRK